MQFLRKNQRYDIVATLLFFLFVYYMFYARKYFSGDIVIGGDTQLLWSFNYLAFYSIKYFGEFLWWDPTTLNGWPAYVNQISGWFNYLGPFSLPSLILFKLASLIGISINDFLVFQKTIYYFCLNILAVILISRVLLRSRLARLLPPMIFTLSAVQFHGLRDSVLYEAMPAPLFLVLAILFFHRRRSPGGLAGLLLAIAFFAANMNYGILQTSIWWLGIFAILLCLFSPSLLPDAWRAGRALRARPFGRLILLLCIAAIGLGALAFFLPVLLNLGDMLRFDGRTVVHYDIGVAGNFGSGMVGVQSHPIWTNFLYWSPFEAVHDILLYFDDKGSGARSGVDQRYIGLLTLPLLFAAIARRYADPAMWALLLSAFLCVAFVALTYRNPAIMALTDQLTMLRNIRTLADTLPRDGPLIFLAIVAAMGLDALLTDQPGTAGERGSARGGELVLRIGCYMLLGVAALCFLAALVPVMPHLLDGIRSPLPLGPESLERLKEAFAHIAVYLFLFTLLCLLLSVLRDRQGRRAVAMALLVIGFADLTVSSDSYWKRGLVWFGNVAAHALPQPARIGPVESSLQTWPGSYGGFIHNPFDGPFLGLRSWLVLASRPQWQPLLANYDPQLRILDRYPDYLFYRGGTYVPFDEIRRIDTLVPPAPGSGDLLLHDPLLAKALPGRGALAAEWAVTDFSPNRVAVQVEMPQDGIMVALDNADPFWSAEVDGEPVPIARANFTFKGIPLPAGSHRVVWDYDPFPVRIVWLAYYVVLLAALGIVLGLGRRRTALGIALAFAVFFGGNHLLTWSVPVQGAEHDDLVNRTVEQGRLVSADGETWLELYPGGRIKVRPDSGNPGAVESATIDANGMAAIKGWAFDEAARSPAKALVVTIGERAWRMGSTGQPRADLAAYDPGHLMAGFAIYGRGAHAGDLAQLRVFLLAGDGEAVELRYLPGLPHGPLDRPPSKP